MLFRSVNSRLPGLVERTRERAILAGDNSPQLRLTLLQGVSGVQRGDRIVTSGHGGSFPVGIPVGEVVQTGEGHIRVRPFADFSRLEFVRVGAIAGVVVLLLGAVLLAAFRVAGRRRAAWRRPSAYGGAATGFIAACSRGNWRTTSSFIPGMRRPGGWKKPTACCAAVFAFTASSSMCRISGTWR